MKGLRLLAFIQVSLCAISCFAQGTPKVSKNIDLQEVVVTGTGTQHLLKDAPVQTEVITRKMLESYGGKNLEDILSGLTASFAFNEGDMGSQMQLGGLGNSYILILVDGKRIHGDVGGENDLGLIDPHNIEKIEIVKGAQSALYGSDAMAGVINIITKKRDKEGITIENTTRYGSHNDVRQHNGIGFTLGKLTSYTNFQLQHTDGWQNTSEEYTEAKVVPDSRNKTVNKYTNWQVAEHLTYDFNKNLSIYADGTYYRKVINRPTNGNYPSCDVYTYDLRYNNASASVGGKWLFDAFDGSKKQNAITVDVDWNKHAYFYDYTARTYEYILLKGEEYGDLDGEWYSVPMYPGQDKLQSDQQRVMAQAKGIFYLPYANTLNAGVEYRYDYLNAPERTETGTASDWTAAAYVQDEYNPVKWLNITAGLRIINNDNFGFRATPKVSTMVSMGDFRLRLGWSQGFKTPTVKELYYRYLHVMGSSRFFNMGNRDLRPQTSNYVSGSLEYRGKRLTASITGYYNKLDNMITLVNVPIGEIPPGITDAYFGDGSDNVIARKYKNMEDAKTYGVDLTVSYRIMPELTVNAAYSYLDTDANIYDADRNRMKQVTIDGMAHSKWNATVLWNHQFVPTYRLGVSLSTRGSSTRYYENNGNGKAFQIWRLNTTHDFGKTGKKLSYRVELGIDNIFNFVDRTMHPYHLGTTSSGTTLFASFAIKFKQGKNVKKASIRKDDVAEE